MIVSVISNPSSLVFLGGSIMRPALLTRMSITVNLDLTFFANYSIDFLCDRSNGNAAIDPPAFFVISVMAY